MSVYSVEFARSHAGRLTIGRWLVVGVSALILPNLHVRAAAASNEDVVAAFTDQYCSSCHNDVDKEGDLDLTSLKYAPGDPANFLAWVKIHDRVQAGEMPPKEKKRPDPKDAAEFVKNVAAGLTAVEQGVSEREGRSIKRRLNRSEYENVLRDLLHAPWLLVQGTLPEDGEVALFNKVSRGLDVSYVHMSQYMAAADYALRQVLSTKVSQPPTTTKKFYARDTIPFSMLDGNPDRGRFPVLGTGSDNQEVFDKIAPLTMGDKDPAKRELEAMGWTGSSFIGFDNRWSKIRAQVAGRYKVRFNAYSIWLGPDGQPLPTYTNRGITPPPGVPPLSIAPVRPEWHRPNFMDVHPGRRDEPLHVYAKEEASPGHRIGVLDLTPEPKVYELGPVWLAADETFYFDAVRFFRSRPGVSAIDHYTNKNAQADGVPGVAFRWVELEGPVYDADTTAGYKLLFGDLPVSEVTGTAGVSVTVYPPSNPSPWEPPPPRGARGGAAGQNQFSGFGGQGVGRGPARVQAKPTRFEVASANPRQDAERLLHGFLQQAYRRPAQPRQVERLLALFDRQFKDGQGFASSMLAMYTAVLASPDFVYLDEKPGRLDDYALATKLALFLWNTAPDASLRDLAARGELTKPEVLKAETNRMLADPKSSNFVEAFLDYWLQLRKMEETQPDLTLYSDYYIDDSLIEGAREESQMYFSELLRKNLPARNIVDSNFTYLNERLALLYGIPGVNGAAMRRVVLPPHSVRGGFMTQASVLKVTANGTTTSPVIRGKWIMERILGYELPPPPASVPAVEPDVRGAVTIRQQLDKHRADESCAACHRKIDPPGFALESFDIFGGYRERYRAIAAHGETPEMGFGSNGHPNAFYYALPVDASGQLADGGTFRDVREFKELLLKNEPQIARNIIRQLVVYATGNPVRFSDRAIIETIVKKTAATQYGVRDILNEIIQSDIFLQK